MPFASCFSESVMASIVPLDLRPDGTQIQEIRNSHFVSGRPFGSFPRLPPRRVLPVPLGVRFSTACRSHCCLLSDSLIEFAALKARLILGDMDPQLAPMRAAVGESGSQLRLTGAP